MIKFILFFLFSFYALQTYAMQVDPCVACCASSPSLKCCAQGGNPDSCLIDGTVAGTFADLVLFERPSAAGIIALANSMGDPYFACLVKAVLAGFGGDAATFQAAILYALVAFPSAVSQVVPCGSLIGTFAPLLGKTAEQIIATIPSFLIKNPYYREGHCAKDSVSCQAVIAEAEAIGTNTASIVSVSSLQSRVVSGLVAHVDGTFEYINCHYTPLLVSSLGTPKWTWRFSFLTGLTAFDAAVVDEKTAFFMGQELTYTLIASRFVGTYVSPTSVSKPASGVIVFLVTSSPALGVIRVQPYGPYLDQVIIRDDQVSIQADRTRNELYYLGHNPSVSRHISLVQLQGFELTTSVIQKLQNLPSGTDINMLENAFRARYLYGKKPISTFRVCDCRVAVGFLDGSIRFYCCQSLRPLHCGIRPLCACCDPAIPIKIRWCCCSRTLYVLYARYIHDESYIRRHHTKTFIRAYEVDFDKLGDDSDSESRGRRCVRRLYTINGCGAVNFEVCCRKKCPVVYVLVEFNGKWYIRAYADGKLLATARLEGRVANNSMALSFCENRHRCRCCKCGVFIPFELPERLTPMTAAEREVALIAPRFTQPVVCVCAKQCGDSDEKDSGEHFFD